jgi:hypothetical protein
VACVPNKVPLVARKALRVFQTKVPLVARKALRVFQTKVPLVARKVLRVRHIRSANRPQSLSLAAKAGHVSVRPCMHESAH